MKKSRSSPSLLFSAQESTKQCEEAATEFPTSRESDRIVAPKSRRRILTLTENEKKKLLSTEDIIEGETTHPSVVIKNSTTSPTKQTATATGSKQERGILSDEEITELIAYDPLVKGYQREIAYWSESAFNKPDVLQERVEEIQRNPALGTGLSWLITKHPKVFCSLAGVNVCGIKNKTRQHAERSLTILGNVLDCYREAVKTAKESLLLSPQTELKRYEKFIGSKTISQILQDSNRFEMAGTCLSDAEVIDMVKQNSEVQGYKERIAYLSKIAFGKSEVLQKQIEDLIKNPYTRAEVTQQLSENSSSLHRVSGFNICGFKNEARKQAETAISHLIVNVNKLANTIKQVKEDILQEHQAKQEHHEPFAKLVQKLHKQRDLLKASHSSESLSATMHHKVTETSRETREKVQGVQPRGQKSKSLALAS